MDFQTNHARVNCHESGSLNPIEGISKHKELRWFVHSQFESSIKFIRMTCNNSLIFWPQRPPLCLPILKIEHRLIKFKIQEIENALIFRLWNWQASKYDKDRVLQFEKRWPIQLIYVHILTKVHKFTTNLLTRSVDIIFHYISHFHTSLEIVFLTFRIPHTDLNKHNPCSHNAPNLALYTGYVSRPEAVF